MATTYYTGTGEGSVSNGTIDHNSSSSTGTKTSCSWTLGPSSFTDSFSKFTVSCFFKPSSHYDVNSFSLTGYSLTSTGSGGVKFISSNVKKDSSYVQASVVYYVYASDSTSSNPITITENISGGFTSYVSHTISFESNGGSAVSAITGEWNSTISLPSCTRDGYKLAGWYTDSGLTTKASDPYTITGDATLYAKWTVWQDLTVNYNANGGSGSIASTTVAAGSYGNVATMSFSAPTNMKASSPPWKDASGNTYSNGAVLDNSSGVGGSMTLYAQWMTWAPKTVVYNANGGSGSMDNSSIAAGSSGYLTACSFSYTNKKFSNWTDGSGNAYADGASIDNTSGLGGTLTLYAQWVTWAKKTIKYYSDSSVVQTQEIDPGSSGSVVAITAKTGYTLAGYATSSGGSVSYSVGQTVYNTDGLGGTLSLYAVWTPNTYTVTLDKQEGTGGSSSVVATYGSVFPNVTPPTRDYKIFCGYYGSTDGGGTQYSDANGNGVATWLVASNATVYAYWTNSKHTVTITKSRSDVECTISASGSGVSASTTGDSLSFTAIDNETYTVTVSYNTKFLAKKYVPSTLGSYSFSGGSDTSYKCSFTAGTEDASLEISFTETPLYSITTDITVSDRVECDVPAVSFSPSPDGESKWFEQVVTATFGGIDDQIEFQSWSVVDANTGVAYESQTAPTTDYSFSIDRNTVFKALFVPKEVDSPTCALDSSSSAVGKKPTCEITDAYVSGEVHCGDTAVFTAATVSGYQFNDWVDEDGNTVSTDSTYECKITGAMSLYARYSVPVTVYFTPQAEETGTVSVDDESSTSSATKYVVLGGTCSIGCVSDYFFAGWYSDSVHSTLLDYSKTDVVTVSKRISLYAYVVSSEFYNYIALYNYDQRDGHDVYDETLGSWSVNGGSSVLGVDEVTRSDYEGAVGFNALSDGRFFRIVGIKRITLSVAVSGNLGLDTVKTYEAANPLGTAIGSVSVPSLTTVVNRNMVFRANWGELAPRTVTASVCTGSDNLGTVTANGSSSSTVKQGEECTMVAVAYNGYDFAGWYADPAASSAVSSDRSYSFTVVSDVTLYAKFVQSSNAIYEWEGSDENKTMRWKSKTFVSSRPFDPTSLRVDALGYVPSSYLKLTVGMFSSPESSPSGTAVITNMSGQGMRRLPRLRSEKFMRVDVENNAEVDAIVIGTSASGVVA